MSPTDVSPRAVPPLGASGAVLPAARRAAEGPSGLELARMLLRGRAVLLGFVALALALAGAFLVLATPRWRGEALLRIEERHEAGADPMTGGLDAPAAKAEIELLRARTLVAAAVDQLGLDVTAAPRRLPVLGTAWARLSGSGLATPPPVPALSRFAWGGEKLSVARLEVPEALLDVPLALVAGEGKRFRLAGPDGVDLAEGRVGEPAEGKDGAGRPVRIAVAELLARPGTEFTVSKRRTSDVVQELQLQLAVEERAKDSGVVSVRLEGTDRAQVAAALRLIVDTYLRENRQRTAARVGRTAALLDERLPALQGDVEKAENALEAWKRKNGWVDVGTETRALLDRSIAADRRIAELEARRDELLRHYSDRHPAIAEVTNQIEALRVQQKLFEARLRSLPASELQAARLARDVHALTAVYTSALEKAQQFRIAAAASVGTASLVDAPAVPEKPSSPNAPLTLALSLLLGLAAGAVAVVIRGHLGGTGDAVEVETATGLPVLGALPHGSTEASLARVIRRRLTGERPAALHAVAPGDAAVEDLRSLRTNLVAALRGARSNVVVVGGPAPGVGKSFVCVNLALLLAASNRKVLLVDADLRRGRMHREFGLVPTPGLSDVLVGTADLDEAIRPSGTEGIDVLAAGATADDPAALLERPRVAELLAEAGKRYDVVLVDSAAILAVTDPALVARHAGLSLLVLRAGEHPVDEIALAVQRLRQGGARVDGAILNDLRPSRHARYRYEYRGHARARA